MQLPIVGRRVPRRVSHVLAGLAAVLSAGCAVQGGKSPHEMSLDAMNLDAYRQEQVRTLTIRCYMEHREELLRSSSPDLRLACREWASERVAATLGSG